MQGWNDGKTNKIKIHEAKREARQKKEEEESSCAIVFGWKCTKNISN